MGMFVLRFKILTSVALISRCLGEYTVRKTNYGRVRGVVEQVHGHKKVEKYLGIPYASPPVGNLRLEVGTNVFFFSKSEMTSLEFG